MKPLYLVGAAIVGLFTTASLPAQTATGTRLKLEPGSQLSLEGTSTLHGFTCKTSQLTARITVDPTYKTASLVSLRTPVMGVQVQIPVKSLTCGNKKLEENMYKTLRADEHDMITYKLTEYDVIDSTRTVSGFVARADGRLTVSGAERPIQLRVTSAREPDGTVTAQAEQRIKMTDFGIKPPTFMMGTLRVGNELVIRFTLRAAPETVAAAMDAARAQAQVTAQ